MELTRGQSPVAAVVELPNGLELQAIEEAVEPDERHLPKAEWN